MKIVRFAIIVAIVAGLLPSPAIAKLKLSGGPGTSMETAIVIEGASGSEEGIMAEYAVLGKYFKGWKRLSQSLTKVDGRYYDVHSIQKGNEKKQIYFDITSFFGKN